MSLEDVLNPQTFSDDETIEAIAAQLAEGRAVVITDAFREELANAVHGELEASMGDGLTWVPYEGWGPYFHFRHHSLRSEESFPPSLVQCRARFESPDMRGLMARLSGGGCDGVVEFGPSLYLPGDFSLPHSDTYLERRLSFVWHLAKDWDPSWGGNFVWCPSGSQVCPGFNVLTLFKVSSASLHLVSPVSPHARSRRFAVHGWYSDARPRSDPGEPPAPGLVRGVSRALYGRPQRSLGGTAKAIAI